ncbi:MAG: hypothetical protein IPP40_09175 [bacterium]|nr:hypothetical protein [bacterium]
MVILFIGSVFAWVIKVSSWQSDTFRVVTGGITEVYFGVGDDLVPFTCQTVCAQGCPSPPPVFNQVASQANCDSIVVTWNHEQIDIDGYRVLIDGTKSLITTSQSGNHALC